MRIITGASGIADRHGQRHRYGRGLSTPSWMLSLAMLMALAATTAAGADTPAGDDFFFHDGDQPVEFIGDSITEQRLYTTLIESFVLSRFPQWHISFRNVGWSGDTSWFQMRGGLENALSRDLLPLKPTAATIDFGMNDARGGQGTLGLYRINMDALVQRLQASGARVAVLSPSPEERYEPGQPAGSAYNAMLATYSDAAKAIAVAHHAAFADQYTPFVGVITRGRAAGILGNAGDPRLIPDGVHPNWGGHLVMAASILAGLHAPSLVSSLAIDATHLQITTQDHCQATLQPGAASGDVLFSVQRLDAALPWPVPADAALVQSIPDFNPMHALSRYELTVSGLAPGRYQLDIDQDQVGSFSADELTAGINLSTRCGPILAQMNQLLGAIMEKNNTYYQRWRAVQLFTAPPWLAGVAIDDKRTSELARLDALIAQQEAAITVLRQPKPHVFQLRYAPPPSPHALLASAAGPPGGVMLHWEAVPAAEGALITGYRIERSLPGAAFTACGSVASTVTSFTDADPAAATATYQVRSLSGTHQSEPSLGTRLDLPAAGWMATFYSDTQLGKVAAQRCDPVIDFTWTLVAPGPTTPREQFSVRWCGVLTAPVSGQYTIIATADDGVRVWIDGRQLIDQWRDQGATACLGTTALSAGSRHDVVITYYQGGGDASMKLEWRLPSGVTEVVPAAAVHPALWRP